MIAIDGMRSRRAGRRDYRFQPCAGVGRGYCNGDDPALRRRRRQLRFATDRAAAAGYSFVGMRSCVIGIAVLAIVLDVDRGLVDGLPAAGGQAIAPCVSSSQAPLALAWKRDRARWSRRTSARRRLRSPRDPRRGDRVRHGAIVPEARLAPAPGRLQNSIGDVGEQEPTSALRAGACSRVDRSWRRSRLRPTQLSSCYTATPGPADRRKQGWRDRGEDLRFAYATSSSVASVRQGSRGKACYLARAVRLTPDAAVRAGAARLLLSRLLLRCSWLTVEHHRHFGAAGVLHGLRFDLFGVDQRPTHSLD